MRQHPDMMRRVSSSATTVTPACPCLPPHPRLPSPQGRRRCRSCRAKWTTPRSTSRCASPTGCWPAPPPCCSCPTRGPSAPPTAAASTPVRTRTPRRTIARCGLRGPGFRAAGWVWSEWKPCRDGDHWGWSTMIDYLPTDPPLTYVSCCFFPQRRNIFRSAPRGFILVKFIGTWGGGGSTTVLELCGGCRHLPQFLSLPSLESPHCPNHTQHVGVFLLGLCEPCLLREVGKFYRFEGRSIGGASFSEVHWKKSHGPQFSKSVAKRPGIMHDHACHTCHTRRAPSRLQSTPPPCPGPPAFSVHVFRADGDPATVPLLGTGRGWPPLLPIFFLSRASMTTMPAVAA